MNPTFGASILSWIPPMWTPEAGLFAIQQASAAGFDLLEILLPPSMEFDAPTVKRQLKQHGLKATCSLNLPKEAHIPFYPKKATCLIKEALDKASELEVDYLGGVLHSGIGVFSGKPANTRRKYTLRYGQRLPNTPPDLESRSVSSRSIAMKVICVPLRRKSCALSNA